MSVFVRQYRYLSWLALVASLSISLLPTLGRFGQGVGGDDPALGIHAMCTAEGMVYRPVVVADQDLTTDSAGRPSEEDPEQGQDEDCAYCPLLASLQLPAPPIPLWHPSIIAAPAPQWLVVRATRARQRIGLGPRGPPLPINAA